jgi:hypothetical protein
LNNYDNYHDDEYDNTDDLNGVHYDAWDHSPPLYNGCRLSIMKSVRMLMDFLISRINLDKQNFINLLKLIKKILPIPNALPTSWKFRKVNLMRKKDSFQNYDKPNGTKVDLLQLDGVRTHMGRFVAVVMDNVFTTEELCKITSKELVKDERYDTIKGKIIIKLINLIVIAFLFLEAVRSRFKLTHEDMNVEWPTLHECVLQKRLNEKKSKVREKIFKIIFIVYFFVCRVFAPHETFFSLLYEIILLVYIFFRRFFSIKIFLVR